MDIWYGYTPIDMARHQVPIDVHSIYHPGTADLGSPAVAGVFVGRFVGLGWISAGEKGENWQPKPGNPDCCVVIPGIQPGTGILPPDGVCDFDFVGR